MSCESGRLFLRVTHGLRLKHSQMEAGKIGENLGGLGESLTADSQELLMEPHQQNIWRKKE